jgi:hypothetical protein
VAVVARVLLDHVQVDPADGAGCAVVGEGVVQAGAGDRGTDVSSSETFRGSTLVISRAVMSLTSGGTTQPWCDGRIFVSLI